MLFLEKKYTHVSYTWFNRIFQSPVTICELSLFHKMFERIYYTTNVIFIISTEKYHIFSIFESFVADTVIKKFRQIYDLIVLELDYIAGNIAKLKG